MKTELTTGLDGERDNERNDERGAALVEFALVATFLLLLVFGIFEMGTAWSKSQLVTQAARSGARSGSQTGTNIASDQAIVQSVEAALGDSGSNLERIVVFNATDPNGAMPPLCETAVHPGVPGLCSVYDSSHYANYGAWVDGAWPPSTRVNDPLSADFVAVRVEVKEPMQTGFFGNATFDINDTAIMRIEPDAGS